MQHNKPTHIVLTIYTVLCGLHMRVQQKNSKIATRVLMQTLHTEFSGNSTKAA